MKKIKFILGITAALIAFYVLFMAVKNIVAGNLYNKNSEKMLSDAAVLQKARRMKIRETFDYVSRELARAYGNAYELKMLEQASVATKRFESVQQTLDSLKALAIPIPFTNYVYVPSNVFEGLYNAGTKHSMLMDTLYMDADYETERKTSDTARSVLNFKIPDKSILSKGALDLIFLRSQTEMEMGWIWYAEQAAKRIYVYCGIYMTNPILWPDKAFAASGDSLGFTFLMPAEWFYTYFRADGSCNMELDNPSQYDSLNVLPDNRFVFTASSDTFDRHGFAQKTVRVKAVFTDMFGDETEVNAESDYWVEKKK